MDTNEFGLPKSEVFVPRTISNAQLGIPEYKVRKPKKPKPYYKKPESIKKFEIDYQNWLHRNSVSPRSTWAFYTFSDNSANALTKLIAQWYRVNGGFASRRNTMGTYSKALGKYIKSGSTRGAEDIDGTINGKNVKIEVKIASDKQRPEQIAYQKMIEESGGTYIIVKSFDSFLEQIKRICDI